MISVTRLDGRQLVVNGDLILSIEETPDTVLTLLTGARLMVKEKPAELVERYIAYRRRMAEGFPGRDVAGVPLGHLPTSVSNESED